MFFVWLVGLPSEAAIQSDTMVDSIATILNEAQKNTYKQPELAASLARQAHQLAVDEKLVAEQGDAFRIIGGTYYLRGDYDLALDNFLEAYQIFEQTSDTSKLIRIISNLGLVYKSLEDYEKSLDYYRSSVSLTDPKDSVTLSKVYNNIGVVHKRQLNYDSAEYYFTESLGLKEGLGDTKGVANTLTNLGNIAAEKGENREALDYFRRSLNLETSLQHDEGIAKNMNNMANAYLRLNQVDSAIYFALVGYEIGIKLKTKLQIKDRIRVLPK